MGCRPISATATREWVVAHYRQVCWTYT